MGDFFGFTFNGYHTSDLGIVRVSSGDRYKEDLLPDLDNATIDVPGGDGTYYFGSYYKSKKFDINIAFDSLTEEQLRNLGRVFSTRKPSLLVFDERPYKGYYVKVDGSPNIEAVCFDEGNSVWQSHSEASGYIPGSIDHKTGGVENIRRVYKGEGEISFIAYDPFGYIIHKDLDSYRKYEYTAHQVVDNPQSLGLYELDGEEYVATTDSTPVSGKIYYSQEDISNTDEWKDAAKLKTAADLEDYDVAKTIEVEDGGQTVDNEIINVYNPGDMPAPFQIYIPFNSGGTISEFFMLLETVDSNNNRVPIDGARLKVGSITALNNTETGIIINTKNHLIEGVKAQNGAYITTGTVYNNAIIEGDFFNINCDGALSAFDGTIVFSGTDGYQNGTPVIIYDYIYF